MNLTIAEYSQFLSHGHPLKIDELISNTQFFVSNSTPHSILHFDNVLKRKPVLTNINLKETVLKGT